MIASEAANLNLESLSETIRVVVEEYAERGIDTWAIGDGQCENFAYRVLELWIGGSWIMQEGRGFTTMDTTWLCDADCQISPAIIEARWGGLPEGVTHEDIEKMGDPGHVWIEASGRYFDAERPEGVDRVLDLPFFQRHLGLLHSGPCEPEF